MADAHHIDELSGEGQSRILNRIWRQMPSIPRAIAVPLIFDTERNRVIRDMATEPSEVTLARLAAIRRDEKIFSRHYGIPAERVEQVSDHALRWSHDHPERMPGEGLLEVTYGRLLEALGYIDGLDGVPGSAKSDVQRETPEAESASEDQGGSDLFQSAQAVGIRTRWLEWQVPAYEFGRKAGAAARALGGESADEMEALSKAYFALLDQEGDDLATLEQTQSEEFVRSVLYRSGLLFHGDGIEEEAGALVRFWGVREVRAAAEAYVDHLLGRDDPMANIASVVRVLAREGERAGSQESGLQAMIWLFRFEAAMIEALGVGLGIDGVGGAVTPSDDPAHRTIPDLVDALPELRPLDEALIDTGEALGLIAPEPKLEGSQDSDFESVVEGVVDEILAGGDDGGLSLEPIQEAVRQLGTARLLREPPEELRRASLRVAAKRAAENVLEIAPTDPGQAPARIALLTEWLEQARGENGIANDLLRKTLRILRDAVIEEAVGAGEEPGPDADLEAELEMASSGGCRHLQYLLQRVRLLEQEARESRIPEAWWAPWAMARAMERRFREEAGAMFDRTLRDPEGPSPSGQQATTEIAARGYEYGLRTIEERTGKWGTEIVARMREGLLDCVIEWAALNITEAHPAQAREG